MIEALIHGKLSREQENMEDVLTSNVFGALKICKADDLLLAFLKQAKTLSGHWLFEAAHGIVMAEYSFWPSCPECDDALFAEPDLELRIVLDDDNKYLLFIESKFLSGKSSFDEAEDEDAREECESEPLRTPERSKDQLAKQWGQLLRHAEAGWKPVLVYLTADTAPQYWRSKNRGERQTGFASKMPMDSNASGCPGDTSIPLCRDVLGALKPAYSACWIPLICGSSTAFAGRSFPNQSSGILRQPRLVKDGESARYYRWGCRQFRNHCGGLSDEPGDTEREEGDRCFAGGDETSRLIA